MENFKQNFEDDIKKAQEHTVLSPEYKRKKLIMYVIRTLIAIVLFYMFWEHQWVKWVLYIYIPVNILFLCSIFGWSYFLKNKISKTQQKVEELMDGFEEE